MYFKSKKREILFLENIWGGYNSYRLLCGRITNIPYAFERRKRKPYSFSDAGSRSNAKLQKLLVCDKNAGTILILREHYAVLTNSFSSHIGILFVGECDSSVVRITRVWKLVSAAVNGRKAFATLLMAYFCVNVFEKRCKNSNKKKKITVFIDGERKGFTNF